MNSEQLVEALKANLESKECDGGIAIAEQFGRSLAKARISQFIAVSAAVMAQYRQLKNDNCLHVSAPEADLLIAASKVLANFGME